MVVCTSGRVGQQQAVVADKLGPATQETDGHDIGGNHNKHGDEEGQHGTWPIVCVLVRVTMLG